MFEKLDDNFDELVSLLSMRSAASVGLTDERVITSIRRFLSQAVGTGMSSDALDDLIDPETPDRDRVSSKVAWHLAHEVPGKVWGVNLQLRSTRKQCETSPILNQLQRAGMSNQCANWERSVAALRQFRGDWKNTVDAVAISNDRSTVFVACGATYGSLKREARSIVVSGGSTNLFTTGKRLLCNVFVPASTCATLVLATQYVRARYPNANVIPLFFVVDDIGAGWQFEATNLSKLVLRDIPQRGRLCIDQFDSFSSSVAHKDALAADPDHLNKLPSLWYGHSPLYMMPPDRRARGLMIIETLLKSQYANPKELLPVEPAALRRMVQQHYDIEYPVDMLRHDLIACEQGRRLITRIKGMGPRYCVTSVGVARFFWAVLKMAPINSYNIDAVMERITSHSELVWKARS
jgi:hypothetical protein